MPWVTARKEDQQSRQEQQAVSQHLPSCALLKTTKGNRPNHVSRDAPKKASGIRCLVKTMLTEPCAAPPFRMLAAKKRKSLRTQQTLARNKGSLMALHRQLASRQRKASHKAEATPTLRGGSLPDAVATYAKRKKGGSGKREDSGGKNACMFGTTSKK